MSFSKFSRLIIQYMTAPVLFSIYPVIFLYTHNVEILVLDQLIMPLLLAIVLAVALFLLFLLILRDKLQTSLAVVGFLILFWNYGMAFEGITKIVHLNHWHILPILLFAYVHLIYLIRVLHRRYSLENINTIAIGVAVVLIIFNLFTLIPAEVKKHQGYAQNTNDQQAGKDAFYPGESDPDIYFIILDQYASLNTIKEEWGYDNSHFEDYLKSNGFFVATKSEHRYSQTHWNMPTLLNLNYLTGPIDKEVFMNFIYNRDKVKTHEKYDMLSKYSESDYIAMMNSNRLVSFLKQRGYKVIILEGISQHYKSFNLHGSDIKFSYQDVEESSSQSFRGSAFVIELVRKTALLPFYYDESAFNRRYVATKYVFDYLRRDVQTVAGPKLIYAHIMCPHDPYVFDRDGNFVLYDDLNKKKKDGYILPNEAVNNAYLEQYIYVTKEIKSLVNNHFKKGKPSKKIFIILNDHGPRPHMEYLQDPTQAFKAFNAVYFPDGDYTKLYENIAPVNTLRVVLNKYFGENFEMLEDR